MKAGNLWVCVSHSGYDKSSKTASLSKKREKEEERGTEYTLLGL